jgi:hypothetical protein
LFKGSYHESSEKGGVKLRVPNSQKPLREKVTGSAKRAKMPSRNGKSSVLKSGNPRKEKFAGPAASEINLEKGHKSVLKSRL